MKKQHDQVFTDRVESFYNKYNIIPKKNVTKELIADSYWKGMQSVSRECDLFSSIYMNR